MQKVESDLVQMLVNQLDLVSPEQAAGGLGLMFRQIKHKLDAQDFATLNTVIPESDELAASAPPFENGNSTAGLLGGLAPALGGGQLASLGPLASLAGCFAKLGLSAERVPRFAQLLLDYVQQQGGEQIRELVEKGLS
ncbi:MAG: hypothetical protein CVV27_13110 [Candidatus Melainabacteria bacterium HGW-Melainabacteria-1]|nr:MAG: hypothetical protein CVV27_13110 [Candidatus Melainabacteria bacterium HGW-Melainabacteria-1]